MDFHLERGLRLHAESELKNLYSWAINEIDAEGQPVGGDQIPWVWTLRFTATSCVLGDGIEINKFNTGKNRPGLPEIRQSEVIRVQLRPGSLRDDKNCFRQTTFSMFGTDRAIKNFQLDIQPLDDPSEQEHCRAWGTVSYTSEADFRHETVDDCIIFYLSVKPETFARYAAKISHGAVDEMVFSAGLVSGFYSGWSPSISTRDVKVLASDEEHKVDMPPGDEFEPPRLGHVGSAYLYINRSIEFCKQAPTLDAGEETAGSGDGHAGAAEVSTALVTHQAQASAVVDPQMMQVLGSLRRAARFALVLLGLIFIATLVKR